MRALNVLLALLISVFLAFAVFEGGLRLLPAFRPQPTLNQFDPSTGWSKQPGLKVERDVAGRRIEFAINQHGLREDESVGPQRKPDTARVLALGDSFVLGYTVEQQRTFVEQLEQRWRSEGRAIEVVNAGVEGWSIDQSVVWFVERGREYAPDLVVLFAYENDIYWCGEERYPPRFDKPRFGSNGEVERRQLIERPTPPLEKLALIKFLGFTARTITSFFPPKDPGPFEFDVEGRRLPGEFAPLLHTPPPFEAAAEARMESALAALARFCSALRVPLVVVPIPSKSAIHADEREYFRTWSSGLKGLPDTAWSPDRPVEIILSAAKRQGIETLDPREALRRDGAERKLYFEKAREWHFNDDGNLALANFLHGALSARPELAAGGPPPSSPSAAPAWFGTEREGTNWSFVGALFAGLWLVLSAIFIGTYPDEPRALAPFKVGGMLALVFAIFLGGRELIALLPSEWSGWVLGAFFVVVLGFVAYKLGRRLATIAELLASFIQRGHWYLMPLLVVLLSIGSLLVVAASSPLIAPFIYTLF